MAEKPPPLTDAVSDIESAGDTPSELPSIMKDISNIPEHLEFIQLLIDAKVVATLQNYPKAVNWKGYSMSMTPDFLMTTNNLKQELVNALQHMTHLSSIEEKVYISKYFLIYYFYLSIYLSIPTSPLYVKKFVGIDFLIYLSI